MKTIDEIFVSVYGSVYSREPRTSSFRQVMSDCIQPVHASAVETIRRYHAEGDNEAAQRLKRALPCFTPAGTFEGAHAVRNFRKPSHIVGLDYDHVPDRHALIRLCADDPHTVAALESPTDGLKVFAYVDNIEGRYREAQRLVNRYYDRLLGMESDPACKDESRLCYFTYSPGGYLSTWFEPFVLPEAEPCLCPEGPALPQTGGADEWPEKEEATADLKQFLMSYIFLNPLTPGMRHTNLFKLACEASRRRYPEKAVFRELLPRFSGTDFSENEIKKVLSAGYQKVNESKEEQNARQKHVSENAKTPKRHYDCFTNDENESERYWEGEELRKNTPFFPEDLFKNLPKLLSECIVEEEDLRQRDISFLADLTALSAALPCTFGVYNHKKYSPHLYSVVIAPAGSGKSIVQTGRYLIEELHRDILRQSDRAMKAYEQAHDAWLANVRKRKKKTEQAEQPEPERPPFKMFIIPATTSYTRMQMQMQDNGSMGSIIFDTEAQSLSTANHLDCGNFDDMLRKAFEHENIDSSFKSNGMRPICISHPKLAMLLTGTPGQLATLLNSSENGLASRILYYTYREAPRWKEMGDQSESLEDRFIPLARRVSELYRFCLEHPLLFHFTPKQWRHLNRTFADLLEDTVLASNDDLQAVVKRYAFIVMRVSMIQTRIRQFENLDTAPEIYCSDVDFEHAMQLVLCCYEHSRLLLSSMTCEKAEPLNNPDKYADFFNHLPAVFTTEEAYEVAANTRVSKRTVTRLLKGLNGLKINKIKHGVYEKLQKKGDIVTF